jgi:2-oxoglutarate-Fe(II)-dependent oxygenase superfamily protein
VAYPPTEIEIFDHALDASLCGDLIRFLQEAALHKAPEYEKYNEPWRKGGVLAMRSVASTSLVERLKQALREPVAAYKMRVGGKSSVLHFATELETPTLLHYGAEDHFDEHADAWSVDSATRVLSLVGFLNDVARGGEISFNRLDTYYVSPAQGRLVIFPSNFLFPHKAMPARSNEKYAFVTWLHFAGEGRRYTTIPFETPGPAAAAVTPGETQVPVKTVAPTESAPAPTEYAYDVVIWDTVGGPIEPTGILGGSEYYLRRLAMELSRRGYTTLIASPGAKAGAGPHRPDEAIDRITYIDSNQFVGDVRCRSLIHSRYSTINPRIVADKTVCFVVDMPGGGTHEHLQPLIDKGAELVTFSKWHASLFPPEWRGQPWGAMIEDDVYELQGKHDPNLFVYASGASKGLKETLQEWKRLKEEYPELTKAQLQVTTQVWSQPISDELEPHIGGPPYRFRGIPDAFYVEVLPTEKVPEFIAGAAGLFFVNTFPETFGTIVAIAEAVGTRCHVLCAGGSAGGIPEAANSPLVTTDPLAFEASFIAAWRYRGTVHIAPNDFRVSTRMPLWLKALGLGKYFSDDPYEGPRQRIEALGKALGETPSNPYEGFRQRLIALGSIDATEASGSWNARCKELAQLAGDRDPHEFLQWIGFAVNPREQQTHRDFYEELMNDTEYSERHGEHSLGRHRWLELLKCGKYGKSYDFSLNGDQFGVQTSPNCVHIVHHLMSFETATGKSLWKDCDVVLELGGGYGEMCRTLRADGYEGEYVILDLPHMQEFQRLYLELHGCAVSLTADPEEAIAVALEAKRLAFVSTFALSETPPDFRRRIRPVFDKMSNVLVASQWFHRFNGFDNAEWFTKDFVYNQGVRLRWTLAPVQALYEPHTKNEMHIFAVPS